ncbi:hypothetical protein [Eisenibacter elegans]|jgi:hypothetical protein|uniref:hypothetical protein n=1 Tax=Eisenibacter elegans TaxID=997 RepID=UPI00047A4D03|nr:hypothetical protein [Eisenibacter elegans]
MQAFTLFFNNRWPYYGLLYSAILLMFLAGCNTKDRTPSLKEQLAHLWQGDTLRLGLSANGISITQLAQFSADAGAINELLEPQSIDSLNLLLNNDGTGALISPQESVTFRWQVDERERQILLQTDVPIELFEGQQLDRLKIISLSASRLHLQTSVEQTIQPEGFLIPIRATIEINLIFVR